jgi:hypothetical protein
VCSSDLERERAPGRWLAVQTPETRFGGDLS